MPLQVYGVVRRGHPRPSAGGRAPDRVRLVESGDLAAAVGQIDEGGVLQEEDAARHLDVLVMLLRDGPVLPMAFGTVSPDEESVRAEVLDPAALDLLERLDAVEGYVETRLSVYFDEAAALREVLDADPELRRLADASRSSGGLDTRIALGETVSARLTEWRQTRAGALLDALTTHVEDVSELEASDPLQQRWTFLVRQDRLAALDEAVARARSALPAASVEYVGPLPVYTFLGRVRLHASSPPASAWQAATTQGRSAWGW